MNEALLARQEKALLVLLESCKQKQVLPTVILRPSKHSTWAEDAKRKSVLRLMRKQIKPCEIASIVPLTVRAIYQAVRTTSAASNP